MIAVDLNATYAYSLKNDHDDPPTVFHLGYIDPQVEAWIADSTAKYEMNQNGKDAKADVVVNTSRRDFNYVRFALRGCDNLKDAQGNDITFSTDSEGTQFGPRNVASKKFMQLAFTGRLKEVQELADVIRKRNALSEEEEKN